VDSRVTISILQDFSTPYLLIAVRIPSGYCILWRRAVPLWTVVGSTINLASITVERYLRVVHPAWSKKHLHAWIIYSAMVFAWVGGFVANAVPIFLTSAVIDGVCHSVAFWINTGI